VLILPDGDYDFLENKTAAGRLKDWVRAGGRLIALQGALAQLAAGDWGIHLKKDTDTTDDKDVYAMLKPYANRERESIKQVIPGAIYKVQLDNTHPLALGYPATYYTLKQDGNIYEFMDSDDNGWNVGVLKKDNYLSGFVGADTRARLKDGLLFGVKDIGNGKLVMLADDPLFRSFWENGKLLFSNAVFLVF
jgi:hypothetical protein